LRSLLNDDRISGNNDVDDADGDVNGAIDDADGDAAIVAWWQRDDLINRGSYM
jgi:hypothetical protein